MRALTSRFHPVLLALALGVPIGAPGCGPKNLTAVETPAAGVKLSYDLTPGARYTGHVRRAETVSTPLGSMNRSLEYRIDLTVLGEDPKRGDILVSARFTNVKIKWQLPPQGGLNISIDEFIRGAVAKVQGMEIRFNVLPDGKVNYLPPPPEDIDPQLGLVIDSVLDSLDHAFFEVPRKKIRAGETWEDKEKRGRKGKLGRYREFTTTITFDGVFRDESRGGETVARLDVDRQGQETFTTKEGGRQNDWNGEGTALFSVEGRYLAVIESETRKFDPKEGTTFTKISVNWEKASAGAQVQTVTDPCDADYVGPEACVPEGAETQVITDPCDPDYVGGEACEDDGSGESPAEEAAPDAPAPDAAADGDGKAPPAGDKSARKPLDQG